MQCNICNFIMTQDERFYYCPNCRFIQKINIPNESEEKKRYDFHKTDESYLDFLKQRYQKFLNINDSILDFGCGRDRPLSQIFNNYNITSYDLYYHNIDYKSTKYSVIIMNEVIEHLHKPYEVLEDLKEILKPKGRIIICTGLLDNVLDIHNWWYQRDITHISFFHTASLKYLAKRLGLGYLKDNELIVLTNE